MKKVFLCETISRLLPSYALEERSPAQVSGAVSAGSSVSWVDSGNFLLINVARTHFLQAVPGFSKASCFSGKKISLSF